MNIYKYLIIINIVTFVIYGYDKWAAINKKHRISEVMLYFLGLIGGFVGSLIAMQFFRHKTRKIRFYVLNILYFIIWILLLWRFLR